jgi:hypothetical protein
VWEELKVTAGRVQQQGRRALRLRDGTALAMVLVASFAAPVFAAKASLPPDIVSVAPDSAVPGAVVTLTGQEFGGPRARVAVGGAPAVLLSAVGNRVSFRVPAAAPAGPTTIRLTNPSGQSDVIAFTVIWGGDMRIVPDTSAAASAIVGRAGGSIEAGGLRLLVPEGALSEPVEITMTPLFGVAGSPYDSTFVGGAHFAPDGLAFLRPATLTIPTGPGIDPRTVAGFAASGAGSGAHLVPRIAAEGAVELAIWHFSVAGASQASPALLATAQSIPPSSAEIAARAEIAAAEAACGLEQAAAIPDGPACLAMPWRIQLALRDWYDDAVAPGLAAAIGASYMAAEGSLREWAQWYAGVQVSALEEQLGTEVLSARAAAIAVVADQVRRRLGNCTGTDLVSQLRDIRRLADLAIAVGMDEPVADDLPSAAGGDLIAACAHVSIDQLTFPNPSARGASHTLSGRASLDVWSGPNRTDVAIALAFDGFGAGYLESPTTAGPDGRFEAAVYVFPTAGQVVLDVHATALSAVLEANGVHEATARFTGQALSRLSVEPGDSTIGAGASLVINPVLVGSDIAARTMSFGLVGPGSLSSTTGVTDSTGRAAVTYTGPATDGVATITVTFDDAGSTISRSITVTTDGLVSVSISPEIAIVATGAQQSFVAVVAGAQDTSVSWSATCGTVSNAGQFTAPSAPATCNVTATSDEDPSASATAIVTVVALDVDVAVSPPTATLARVQSLQLTAQVTGTPNQSVSWVASCGSVESTGLFTAPDGPGSCVVTATSVVDPSASGSAVLTVTGPTWRGGLLNANVGTGNAGNDCPEEGIPTNLAVTSSPASLSCLYADEGGAGWAVMGLEFSESGVGDHFQFDVAATGSASASDTGAGAGANGQVFYLVRFVIVTPTAYSLSGLLEVTPMGGAASVTLSSGGFVRAFLVGGDGPDFPEPGTEYSKVVALSGTLQPGEYEFGVTSAVRACDWPETDFPECRLGAASSLADIRLVLATP